jgi:hypothetical protein
MKNNDNLTELQTNNLLLRLQIDLLNTVCEEYEATIEAQEIQIEYLTEYINKLIKTCNN